MTAVVEAPVRSTRKARRKAQHWFNRDELERAHEVGGLVLLAYCGRPERCGFGPEGITVVEIVGWLMAVDKPRDCKSCVRAYEAYLRRANERHERWSKLNGT